MTQIAVGENVVGDFDGTTVHSGGLDYRVYRRGDEYWTEMPDPDVMMYIVQGGKKLPLKRVPRIQRRVVMTTGSHHYQTYWVESVRYDRLMQTLPLIYLINDKRWIPREAAFMLPPHGERMVTQWNHHCIRCHSTGGIPGLDKETGMLNTRVGELGISCEACHGPGARHVQWHQQSSHLKETSSAKNEAHLVNPNELDHRASSQICGQCHGVYIMRNEFAMRYAYEGVLYRPGEDLHRTRYYIQHPRNEPTKRRVADYRRNPDFFRERWWDDGTVLAGGREYTALSVSGCYARGKISCLSCHTMHGRDPVDQLKPEMRGNAACTQCHDQPQYTSELTQHTFHQRTSAGSECMNCHMPHTTYALLNAIRNHQIAAPDIASSVRYGVPNACNLCHLDKTLDWTQNWLTKRYGYPPTKLTEEQATVSAALLWLLKGHAAQRVITAWHVGWKSAHAASGNDWLAPFQARLLADPYAVVRYVAAQNLRKLPGFEQFQDDFLAPTNQLAGQVRQVVAKWRSQLGARPLSRTGREVLIDRQGILMEDQLRSLLDNRDNRSVTIKE